MIFSRAAIPFVTRVDKLWTVVPIRVNLGRLPILLAVEIFATRLSGNSIRIRYSVLQLRRLFFSIILKLAYDIRYDCKRWKICKTLLHTSTYKLLVWYKSNYFGNSRAILLTESLFQVATSFLRNFC